MQELKGMVIMSPKQREESSASGGFVGVVFPQAQLRGRDRSKSAKTLRMHAIIAKKRVADVGCPTYLRDLGLRFVFGSSCLLRCCSSKRFLAFFSFEFMLPLFLDNLIILLIKFIPFAKAFCFKFCSDRRFIT